MSRRDEYGQFTESLRAVTNQLLADLWRAAAAGHAADNQPERARQARRTARLVERKDGPGERFVERLTEFDLNESTASIKLDRGDDEIMAVMSSGEPWTWHWTQDGEWSANTNYSIYRYTLPPDLTPHSGTGRYRFGVPCPNALYRGVGSPIFYCTRIAHHTGRHAHGDGRRITAVW